MTYSRKGETISDTYTKAAGALLFLGAAQFIVAMIVAEAVYPDYSVSNNYISDLGVGPAALIFNTSVFLLGVAVVVCAYLIFRVYKKPVLVVLVILFVLTGIGAMGVGAFPETAGSIHTVVSFVAFFFGGLSAVFAYSLQKPPLNYLSFLMGVFSLTALALFASQQYFGLGPGGMERMIVYPLLLWAIAFGGHLIGYSEKL